MVHDERRHHTAAVWDHCEGGPAASEKIIFVQYYVAEISVTRANQLSMTFVRGILDISAWHCTQTTLIFVHSLCQAGE